MTDEYRIPEALEPFTGESLHGLAMRYATAHRYAVTDRLFFRLGGGKRRYVPTYASLDPASDEGTAVARLLNLGQEQARLMSTWHPERSAVSILGHRVDVELTGTWERQVCPSCLREAPYHRALWLVAAMPACAVHSCWLTRDCPACGKRLRWNGPGVQHCSDPACARDLSLVPPEPVPGAELAGIAGLHRMFHGEPHPTGMAFGSALRAVMVLGWFRLGYPRTHRLSGEVERRRRELPRILERGWAALDPWPAGYHGFLEELATGARDRQARYGLERAYGPLARLLTRCARQEWAAALIAEMADHGIGRPEVELRPEVARRLGSGRREGDRYLSRAEAARMLGLSLTGMARLGRDLGIDGDGPRQAGQRRYPADRIRALAQLRADQGELLTDANAAELLGISVPTLLGLVEDGSLRQVPPGEQVTVRWRVRRADVDALLQAFEAAARGCPAVDRPGPEHRMLGPGGSNYIRSVRQVVRAVLAGEVAPVAVLQAGNGLKRYLF